MPIHKGNPVVALIEQVIRGEASAQTVIVFHAWDRAIRQFTGHGDEREARRGEAAKQGEDCAARIAG